MLLELLKSRFAEALRPLVAESAHGLGEVNYLDQIRPAQDAKFGDFQANMAMAMAKKLGRSPRDVAAEILSRLQWADILLEPQIAGPGFINLTFTADALARLTERLVGDERLGVVSVAKPRTYLLDYSAPNVAKPMHVGHIRSTMIGNALDKILRFCGHRVISDNHLGDWGTQFGMILYGWRHFLDASAFESNPVEELARLYRLVREKADADPAVRKEVLAETAQLHHGNEENLALWKRFLPACRDEIDRVYGRLGVSFDHTLGESFYQDRLAPLVARLLAEGIAQKTDGAVGIFLDGGEVPMLIQKSDGGYLYATTDLATLEYRREEFHPDAILYVVDFRQSHHFEQLFAAAKRLGMEDMELVHVKFGTVLGEDNKPFKTRAGDTVGLESLLDEAERRAREIVVANDRDGVLAADEIAATARTIGIGALVYADLAQNRESDYVFCFDKMLAMNGNTATYMQYAYARIRSIFAKGGIEAESLRHKVADHVGNVTNMDNGSNTDAKPPMILLADPTERALALALLGFSEAVFSAARDYRPNYLTAYLYELAGKYSAFFERCPVLKATDDATRTSRLALCDLTARIIRHGLALLGIGTVERM